MKSRGRLLLAARQGSQSTRLMYRQVFQVSSLSLFSCPVSDYLSTFLPLSMFASRYLDICFAPQGCPFLRPSKFQNKSGPNMLWFLHFDLEMRFAPRGHKVVQFFLAPLDRFLRLRSFGAAHKPLEKNVPRSLNISHWFWCGR